MLSELKERLFWIPPSLKMPFWLQVWFYGSPPIIGLQLGRNICFLIDGTLSVPQLFVLVTTVAWFAEYVWLFKDLDRIITTEKAWEAMQGLQPIYCPKHGMYDSFDNEICPGCKVSTLFTEGIVTLRQGLAGITDEKLAKMGDHERQFVESCRSMLREYDARKPS